MEKEKQNQSIFHIESKDAVQSPEKLNEYIRIGSAGSYILIAALVIVTLALITWGFVGRIPVTMEEKCVVIGDDICICFVDVAKNTGILPTDNPANIRMLDGTTFTGSIEYVTDSPLSAEEVRLLYGSEETDGIYALSDWMLDNLLEDSKYNYFLAIMTEQDITRYWHQIADVTIITDEVSPISFLVR